MRFIKEIALICLGFFAMTAVAGHQPHAGMLRSPHVSETQIVFIYAQQLWVVSKSGGQAAPLANPPGNIINPRFSPDGEKVAFSANYDGNGDLYWISTEGGVPFRVTHHPAMERLSYWTPDGKDLLYSARGAGDHPRTAQVFKVSADGGLPEELPVPYGAHPTISQTGEWLAYTPYERDRRTWKRYRGGMASDIWLFNLKDLTSKKITNWEGTDSFPMWHGDRVFYLSDQGKNHRLNIWVYDLKAGSSSQVTEFDAYDVKYPAMGPMDIVFQNGSKLFLLDLNTLESSPVEITVPGDRVQLKEKLVNAGKIIRNGSISSTGKRALIEARGDIWSLPAKNGSARNLTATDSVHERSPIWSPDKKWIVFFSDEAGSYDLYRVPAVGSESPERVTNLEARFLYTSQWSPDSRYVSFWNRSGELYLVDLNDKEFSLTKVVKDPALQRDSISFSSDSRFLAYTRGDHDTNNASIYIYDIDSKVSHRVTTDFFNNSNPVFDREGKYLFFTSNRYFERPLYEDLGTTWVYTQTEKIYVIPLSSEEASPFAPLNDEEELVGKNDESDDKNGDKSKQDKENKKRKKGDKSEKEEDSKEEIEEVDIDFSGLAKRAIALPLKPGSYRNLAVNDSGHLLFIQRSPGTRKSEVMIFDLKDEKRESKSVIKGVTGFDMSADGKKILVAIKGKFAIIDAKPKQKAKTMILTSGMESLVQPRNEWRQVFTEAWRFYRDFFYDPNMHGVDWDAVYHQYEVMLGDCVTRSDLSFLIREMISELNVGHAYYRGSREEMAGPRKNVGLLGIEWEFDQGTYRIAGMIQGGTWDEDARGPLNQPGIKVQVGDYIHAVNGRAMNTALDPWASFIGLAGKTVTLRVSDNPEGKDSREVIVKLLSSERALKYRSWVEAKRSYVASKSNGSVGYIYVPNTGIQGQNELVRQFYGQIGKKALIIDERWNGGGQIPTRFVELLNRPVANYWALRDGKDWVWPPDSHQGPKCMLINGLAGSGGDYFPYWFKASGIGKLIGTRTWGGLVGISGEPGLLDGSSVTIPSFAFYENDGTWGIEGHGVDPDIVVVDDPALMQGDADPQLDRAIAEMLKEIKEHPFVRPERPDYPQRDKMGVLEKDK